MFLTYVDESYTRDYYFIAGLLVPEKEAIPLTLALDEVVGKAANGYRSIREDAELHGHELFHGKGDWLPLDGMARARIGIYNDAFAAIAQHDVRIILRGMDVARQRTRYASPDPPHQVVLTHLLERVDDHARVHDELAVIIADEVEGQTTYRRDLWLFQRFATWGYRARKLTRIVDTMHFVPSHHSRLVQAADLIAFLHRRRRTHPEVDERATRANEALWGRISPKIVHQQTWYP